MAEPTPQNRSTDDAYVTRETMFGHLNSADPGRRSIAWSSFKAKYERIIASFARKLGIAPTDIDDVIQDVTMQFFQQSETFRYDRERGRFRGFLKTVTYRTIRDRYRSRPGHSSQSIDELDPADSRIDEQWNEVWDRERLSLAMEAVANHYARNRTFQAFEQHVVSDLDVNQVAQQLNMSVESVYKSCQRVKEALREEVKRMEDQDEG